MGNEFWDEYNRLKNKKKKNETEDIAPVRTSNVETSANTDTETSFWSVYEKEKARVEEWRNENISKRSDDGKSIVPVNYKRDSDKEEKPAGSKVTKETDKKESEKDKRTWFQKGAFSDGYQFGDAFKSFMATGSDLALGIVEGLGTMGEGVLDAGVHLVGYVADELGADSFAQKAHELANKNEVQELFQSVRYNAGADENGVFKDSLLGAKSRGVNNALGQIGGVIITGGAAAGAGMSAAGASAVTMGTMGASSFGSGVSEAYNSGTEDDPTSDAEAFTYGAISAASDVVSEMIFGGLGKQVKILGVSHGLSSADDVLAKTLSNKISSTLGKNLVEWGVKAGAEGLEEVIAGFGQAVGKKVTYMSEEELWDIVQDENLLEQFVVGALASGVAQAPSVHTANKAGVDYVSGLTANEEAVVNRVVEDTIAEAEKNGTKLSNKEKNDIREKVQTDMERGRISTDTIEEVLGGESYKAYTDAVAKEDALRKEYADLGKLQNPTLAESTRYKELHDQRETFSGDENRNTLRGKVRDNVLGLVQGTRLAESYAEKARRGEYFTDDLTTYKNEYARKSVENLVNSKAANNTNRTRELAETVAKIAQDKNITFDFTTDEKIKADGKAYISKKNITADGNAAVFDLGAKNLDADFTPVVTVNGKAVDGFKVDYENGTITFASAPEAGEIHVEYRRSGSVNGYYDKQNRVVTVNLNSPKAWQFIVGHEVTHSLEGTDSYKELSRAIAEYAKTKGDYDGRWDALSSAYNSGTDIDTEITSDLVGEYLFTDEAFVQHLSTNHRNVFQRIYDEIKHLYKMVTAGSKEARELEKVKHAFEKAYRAQAETSTDNSGVYDEETDAQYSLVTDKETVDFLENQEHVKVYRAMQVIDGELYPPMAAVIPDGSKQLVEPTKQGEWYRADERPDLMIFSVKQEGKKARLLNKAEMKQNADVLYGNPQADDIITLKDGSTVTFGELTPKYNLDKGNKSTVPAAYNPYFHTSLAALNDQFSTAFKRPNLVVVEGYIPKSELTSGYQALYAKDSVGETEWHSGPVASALKGEKARKVFLSRWFKVGRIVSDAEAASMIAETLEGEGLSVPWNVVTPSLREALAAKGVDIDYKDVKLGSTTVTFDSTQDSVQYSISVDSEGNKLTPEQQERFKDSKVRDENGNLKVMYHGTPNGDFTVFKDGTYFTDNKAYADLYQNPGASSISVKNGASAPKTFEVYLDIKKPFDISDPAARDIYINEYIKGGNAVGINPYLSDTEYDKISSIDWTEGEDLRDFLQENGYDYDGLVLDEGATGGYGEDVKYRGKSYVVFSPEQVKNIDNIAPTNDPDIRFSLSTSVEETKDLMAIHNLHTSEVLKQIDMGGLVYPSVAITNPSKITHDDFGDVSLILKKDAIDPKNSKYNKIYSTDAYTPTFPHVSYEANSDVAEGVSARVKAHFDKLPDYYQRSIRTLRDYTNLNDALNRWGGVGGMIDSYIDDHGMKQLYLAEKGESVPMVVDRTEAELTDYQKWMYQTVVDKLGEDEINALNDRGNFNTLGDARIAWTKEHLETIKDVFADIWSSDGTLSKEEALEIANEQKLFYWYKEATAALKYLENGGLTVVEKENIDATNAKIDEKIEGSDYKKWLIDLFSGIEGQSGIRNNKDTFLPSGKRRSFSQLHDPVTIDNVIKAMRKKGQQGEGAFGIGNIYGASAKTYGSIAETKKHSGELGVIEQAEYDAIKERVDNKLFDIAGRYSNGKDIIDAKNTLVEAVAKCESKSQIANYLKQFDYVYKYTDSIVDDLISLRDYIRSLPRPYFEAKPQRAVGFDEVGVFVIPRNADANLKQELLNRGYSIAEYDPDVEGDRAKVVNSFEEYKFSLSSDTAPVMGGNWRTPARDLRYEGAEDIAPSAPAEVATDTNAGRKIVSEADFAPIPEEVANATQDELLDSVRDEDAPPEMDAPYYGEEAEQAKPADPFAEKDIETVGKRNIKAYMYENPEVKPFFQKEANYLLGELQHATKGERMHLWGDFGGYGAESYHRVIGTKRNASPDIEYLLDTHKYSYEQIEKGIKAILEDNGAENNAVSKRIEFILNDRLRDGYQDWETGMEIPPDEGYLNLLREKEITEYNEEAFKRLVETADDSIVPPAAEDIAPARETVDGPADDVAPAADDVEITTTKERITAKLNNTQTELDNNKRLRAEAKAKYAEQIESLQKLYDSKKNKNTKAANNILRRIERLKRLSGNVDADYAKRISDLETRTSSLGEQMNQDHTRADALERAYARIDRNLEADRAALDEEFAQRRASLTASLADRNSYISAEAGKLYDEISSLRKGVRASKELGYLLDLGYDWNSLKAALAHTKRSPGAPINTVSEVEVAVRDTIAEGYEAKSAELSALDGEYGRAVERLEAEAEAARNEARNAEDRFTRKVLHQTLVENVRTGFAERGYDLDAVLKNAKDLSTFATVDNTPQRVMEKSLGYKEGGILADMTVNKVAQNESEAIKWLNTYTDKKNGLLAQLSRQYRIKPGSKESAAAQMYAEGFYVNKHDEIIQYGDNELAADFPDRAVQDRIKGLASDPRIRLVYDQTLDLINDSRTRNAYPEIQKLDNYFLHFRAMDDTFSKLGLPFNPNDIRAKDLPTDLNGVTADLLPGQPYFASAMHREGKRTSFDLLGGLERYLTGAKNQIFHIDDIQTLRALRNYIADSYGQAKGLESLDALTEEEVQDRIKEVYGSHLSTFAKFLNEEANIIAGKTSLADRGLEGIIGRRGITFLDSVNKQVGANMVGFNVSSSLTNFLPVVQTFAKANKGAFVKAFAQTVSNKLGAITGKSDGFADESTIMIRRKGADRFYRTPWQKMSDPGYFLMGAVDDISTEIIARTKYNELTSKGMASSQAHYETDKWVSRLMGDRSIGQQPHLYNSKMLGLITKFQLEVRNQLDSMFYDTIQEAKVSNEDVENGLARNAKTAAKVASTFFQLAVAQHVFGKVFESIAGYNPAFDIIEVISTAFGWDDDDDSEDTVLDNIEQGFLTLLEDLPYTSTLTGGRIPISSALPITEFIKGKDQYGNEKSRWDTLAESAPYYLMPGGYGQAKKTIKGLRMFDDDLPVSGSYTDSGNLRFPVEDTVPNRIQAALFGQWASNNARDYFDNERKPLAPKQIEEYQRSEMTIGEYWDYREGLSGLSTFEEKAAYINSLDIPLWKKTYLVNNLTDRKEQISMEDYEKYGSVAESDFANANPARYELMKQNGVTYEQYKTFSDEKKNAYSWASKNPKKYEFIKSIGYTIDDYAAADDDKKEAWTWAYNNPEKYAVSKAVSDDLFEYRRYASELDNIKADKDANGKSISGSRKDKVIDYINGMDADFGAKIVLFRMEYPADDTYNNEIIDYINDLGLSYGETKSILETLGFKVSADGYITWD